MKSADTLIRQRLKTVSAYYPITRRSWAILSDSTAAQLHDFLSQGLPGFAHFVLRSGVGRAVFDLTWDSCRYLGDIEVVEVAARLYRTLIRFSALNRLSRLQVQFLERAGKCWEICNKLRDGKSFPEAQQLLDEQTKDALDLPVRPKAKPMRRRIAERRD